MWSDSKSFTQVTVYFYDDLVFKIWTIVVCQLPSILDSYKTRLQALVYDILPSTTDTADYATGLEKLSANERQ